MNQFVYAPPAGMLGAGRLLSGYDPAIRRPPLSVDVRDVARAHVLPLRLPPSAEAAHRLVEPVHVEGGRGAHRASEAGAEGSLARRRGKGPALAPFATFDTGAEGLRQVAGHHFEHH